MQTLSGYYSIITIVNHEDLYQEFKKSLAQQEGVRYELIRINNEHQEYDSARTAFNVAAKKAHGDYLIFLHPDIRFLDSTALYDVLKQVEKIPELGVAGVAGSPFELHSRHAFIVTTLVQGLDQSHVGEAINHPTKVQTVDECFFVMKKEFWQKHPFSTIKGWHMYAVEQCLVALENQLTNYVVPSRLWHRSTGSSENWQYVQTGYQIIRRYGAPYQQINTTVGKWETHGWKAQVYPPLKFAKRQLRRKLGLKD